MVDMFRESGDGESARPTPSGDFDGTTRVDAMRALMTAHRDDRRRRLLRWLRRPLLERIGKAMSIMVWAGIVWTGPKLTPQEAADVLRPHQTAIACDCFNGPYVASTTPTLATALAADYVEARLRRATEATSRTAYVPQGRRYDALHARGQYSYVRLPTVQLPSVRHLTR